MSSNHTWDDGKQLEFFVEENPNFRRYDRTRQEYQREYKKKVRSEEILNRPFIAWDGEGWEENGIHHYKFIANSLGGIIHARPGMSLSSNEVFKMFMETRRRVPNAFHVVFGGNYDFNCIVRGTGLSRFRAAQLHIEGWSTIAGYRVKLMSGRMLQVKETNLVDSDNSDDHSFVLYDVHPFFQKSFIAALDEYFPNGWEGRELIVEMKEKRREFENESLQKKIDYNFLELKNLVRLMDELRKRLYDSGVLISRWYGPGAIASKVLRNKGIKEKMDQEVSYKNRDLGVAVRSAYAGGRFELIKCGYRNAPIYEYDINSAYPYAMTFLPNLQKGTWEHYNGDPGPYSFALYKLKISFLGRIDEREMPYPLFRRDEHDAINFPHAVCGWYWTPEFDLAKMYCSDKNNECTEFKVLEAWVFHVDDIHDRPFEFIHEMYRQRQFFKKIGSGAHIGLKLAMNSMYGKMAQQIGWKNSDKTGLRLPPFHQLEWAGYVTSHCRAQVMQAVLKHLPHVIAFETDAVFVDVPLPHLKIGTGLGEWEYTEFSDMLYIQSGTHWGTIVKGGKEEIEPRTRGIADRFLSKETVMEKLSELGGHDRIYVEDSQFITVGKALHTDFRKWCQWVTTQKKISALQFDIGSKRDHLTPKECPSCLNKDYTDHAIPIIGLGEWHHTWVCDFRGSDYENREHKLAWLLPQKDRMTQIMSRKLQYDTEQEPLFL